MNTGGRQEGISQNIENFSKSINSSVSSPSKRGTAKKWQNFIWSLGK